MLFLLSPDFPAFGGGGFGSSCDCTPCLLAKRTSVAATAQFDALEPTRTALAGHQQLRRGCTRDGEDLISVFGSRLGAQGDVSRQITPVGRICIDLALYAYLEVFIASPVPSRLSFGPGFGTGRICHWPGQAGQCMLWSTRRVLPSCAICSVPARDLITRI